MVDFELSDHARDVLVERGLSEEWLWRVIGAPDQKWSGVDGNQHYAKAIIERQNRVMHVVVNERVQPRRIVTVFLDRRLRKQP
jgi:hypothetical protein